VIKRICKGQDGIDNYGLNKAKKAKIKEYSKIIFKNCKQGLTKHGFYQELVFRSIPLKPLKTPNLCLRELKLFVRVHMLLLFWGQDFGNEASRPL